MNERWFERVAEDYLADGPTVLADRVFDAALGEVHLTRQRRVLWRRPWRFPIMNSFAKYAIAAVAVIAVGFVGLTILRPAGTGPGGPSSAVPSATIAPTPTPSPTASPGPTGTPVPSAPALTGQFTSDQHGYAISYPEGWVTRPATIPWTSEYVDFGTEAADLIHDPTLESSLFLALASQPLGDRTPDEWEADTWQIVLADDPATDGCASEAEPVTIGGAPGVMCGHLALVTEGGRGYWIQLYTSNDEPWVSEVYNSAWFASVLATVELRPEDAVE